MLCNISGSFLLCMRHILQVAGCAGPHSLSPRSICLLFPHSDALVPGPQDQFRKTPGEDCYCFKCASTLPLLNPAFPCHTADPAH